MNRMKATTKKGLDQSLIILVLFLIIFLSSPYQVKADEKLIADRKAKILAAVLKSAENLLKHELQIVEEIKKAEYLYIETELYPTLPSFLNDVQFLLNWAYRIDNKNIKVNFLLGQVFYLKHDLGTGFCDRISVETGKFYLKKTLALYSLKKQLTDDEIKSAKKMLKELRSISDEACDENLR